MSFLYGSPGIRKDIPFLKQGYIKFHHNAFPEQSTSEVGNPAWIAKRSIQSALIYVKGNT
jgi:hypothetical protein